MTLAHVAHRIATNPTFAADFIAEPRQALRANGLTLDDESIAAVQAVLRGHPRWQELCSPMMDPPEYPWTVEDTPEA
jgi:hypothetical protein